MSPANHVTLKMQEMGPPLHHLFLLFYKLFSYVLGLLIILIIWTLHSLDHSVQSLQVVITEVPLYNVSKILPLDNDFQLSQIAPK